MAVAACSPDKAAPPISITSTTVATPRPDDGVLIIGVLTPQDSANAGIGQAIGSAVTLATTEINAAGGYGNQGILLEEAPEAAASGGIDPAIADLLNRNVDAIIGPASSISALAGLGQIINAGVVACSPTASASLLDGYPDHNLFFRTIPSDSLQAVAIAEQVDITGASQVTVAYIDDAYGEAFADAVKASLIDKDIVPTESVPFSADNESIEAAALRVAVMGVGVVVVIGDATSGPVMLGAIDSAEPTIHPIYVVNDAMRRPTTSAEPMGESLAGRVFGVSPVAYSTDAQFLTQLGATPDNQSPYAANAFDCVNLIALAALAGKSTLPENIAEQIPAVSASGSPCRTFADCRTDLEAGSNINYEGPGGSLTLGSNGDPSEADFDVFGFDASGRDTHKGFVRAPG